MADNSIAASPHVMIDIETFGNSPRAALVEIGACLFNPETGMVGEAREWKIRWNDATRFGQADGETIVWWLNQSPEALRLLQQGERMPIARVLHDFAEWLPTDAFVWGKGPCFDMAIIANTYEAVKGQRPPWRFRNERCVRTVMDLARIYNCTATRRYGVAHSGRDDAVSQAVQVIHAYGILKLGPGWTPQLETDLKLRGF